MCCFDIVYLNSWMQEIWHTPVSSIDPFSCMQADVWVDSIPLWLTWLSVRRSHAVGATHKHDIVFFYQKTIYQWCLITRNAYRVGHCVPGIESILVKTMHTEAWVAIWNDMTAESLFISSTIFSFSFIKKKWEGLLKWQAYLKFYVGPREWIWTHSPV